MPNPRIPLDNVSCVVHTAYMKAPQSPNTTMTISRQNAARLGALQKKLDIRTRNGILTLLLKYAPPLIIRPLTPVGLEVSK